MATIIFLLLQSQFSYGFDPFRPGGSTQVGWDVLKRDQQPVSGFYGELPGLSVMMKRTHSENKRTRELSLKSLVNLGLFVQKTPLSLPQLFLEQLGCFGESLVFLSPK